MKKLILLLFLNLSFFSFADKSIEILNKVDANLSPDSIYSESEMIIHKKKKKYTKKMISYGLGKDKAFVEFTYPSRDRGTKFLRIENNLWMFLPKADRTQKLSGHMLRRSMMGSDFSYEDETNREKITEKYNSKILDETKTDYKLELIAKVGKEVTYSKEIVWVDKKTFIFSKVEMYADSGKLLKVMTVTENLKVGDKYYPKRIIMDDKLKKRSYTEIITSKVLLNIEIPEKTFSLRNLERK